MKWKGGNVVESPQICGVCWVCRSTVLWKNGAFSSKVVLEGIKKAHQHFSRLYWTSRNKLLKRLKYRFFRTAMLYRARKCFAYSVKLEFFQTFSHSTLGGVGDTKSPICWSLLFCVCREWEVNWNFLKEEEYKCALSYYGWMVLPVYSCPRHREQWGLMAEGKKNISFTFDLQGLNMACVRRPRTGGEGLRKEDNLGFRAWLQKSK